MWKPSNSPGAVMLPFQSLPTFPTINISMQEAANAVRPAGVLAAAMKALVLAVDAPPSEINVFRLGFSCFSLRISAKLPYSGHWLGMPPVGGRELSSKSAHASAMAQLGAGLVVTLAKA